MVYCRLKIKLNKINKKITSRNSDIHVSLNSPHELLYKPRLVVADRRYHLIAINVLE